ncbi:MAG: UDP-N-acetylmuramoylalanine--D-glutamate ligase [Candidatus Parcubacteria bacterium]|nr:MAG: UDP-N-acetylmuramoylalanine--D-glutamate ligase [Candidatus Parcubacteria bacterium]
MEKKFKDKKVLLLGLGVLGGGIAMAKWLFKQGAKLKISDLKNKKELKQSLLKLKDIKAQYILGKHRYQDIDWANQIVVNPAVSYQNNYVQYALKRNKIIDNDCSLFFTYAQGDIIAVTGTRGKTTTTTWIYQLLTKVLDKQKKIFLGGNQPEKGLLKILPHTTNNSLSIIELSSFQLEFYRLGLRSPKIAIITSIFNDHLNRYKSMVDYVTTKMKIFQNQKENDYLILNYDNEWTNFILKGKPKSQIFFVSLNKLQKEFNGVYYFKDHIFIKDNFKTLDIGDFKKFKNNFGEHNLTNFLFAILSCYLYLKLTNQKFDLNIKKYAYQLIVPKYRQEKIYQNKHLMIINDSASTSPDAVISAIKRFSQLTKNLILITGGTDKNLDFKNLALLIKKFIRPSDIILLDGTATKKLIKELENVKYHLNSNQICQNLKECLMNGLNISKKFKKSIILFSPGAASFEKFKNEFDRGKKFDLLVKNVLKFN